MVTDREPLLSLRYDRITAYSRSVSGCSGYGGSQKYTGSNVRQHVEGLSSKAIKRLKNSLNILAHTAKWKTVYSKQEKAKFRYKLNFITLTLPSKQIHSDSEIVKKILSPFLNGVQRSKSGFLYVWKAEVQDNGNIHFHVTSNTYIHHRVLRNKWNQFCNKLGYIDRCSVKDPNSTDVHSVKDVRYLAAYLASYMGKKDVYTKLLKRYHRRFKAQLFNLQADVFELPKNYFAGIKRKIECPIWNASKPLLCAPLSVSPYASDHLEDVSKLDTLHISRCISEYTTTYYPLPSELSQLRSFLAALNSYHSSVILLQNKVLNVEVSTFN